MSADSPRRGVHKGAQVISPQPVNDRSIIDSVAGIINDIVPQAYSGAQNSENKESITWARFEYADINDPTFYPDYNEGSSIPSLLLVLGYATGVQVWLIAASGEATEVLSWRQGLVRTLRILPSPRKHEKHNDPYEAKRPMVAICDSASPGPQFSNISFVSLKTGEQVKSIKFKNPVCDILANKRSIVVTFVEKIAVFDARTLEDVLTVTTCYPSPGPNPNPVALGTRWLAYSEKKLIPAKRSSGGSEGEGVQSYTATVLYAAKSLGKGLRGLGETVASSLTGNSVIPAVINQTGNEATQPGVVTIIDLQAAKEEKELDESNIETVVAHFCAHNEAIVAMTFDLTGAVLITADKRGHDFHVFRIQPHPGGPTLAAVHHLYVLHRGDTTAKVQDMVFSSDTRWAAISTVRGTTHVFPVAPYGGPVGVRTHSTPHVVNRLSRFHRSAGLTDDGARSHSPVSHSEIPLSIYPYTNPRLPPYPHPTILNPLAQIRQPSTLNHTNNQSQPRTQQRQRIHSDDSINLSLKICACFAPPRAWIYAQRDSTNKITKRAVDSLFIMACHGNMIQYDLEPKPASGIPKEKVCDDTAIELEVEVKGQWPLLRSPGYLEIAPPLPQSSPFLNIPSAPKNSQQLDSSEDRWLSQVEIVTHAGPHRRLWMGPQFVFKTYNAPSGAAVNLVEAETVDIGVTGGSRPARSNPVNMPHAASKPLVPVVIDGSGSSYEQSPRFMEAYGDSLENDTIGIGVGENQLREDLAEAMLETSAAPHRGPGRRLVIERVGQPVTKVVNPLGTVITVSADDEDVTSSQEFEPGIAEETTPEPPRSVCAEEGPASLGDFESEGQALREHTEICAEMRSASEPAIDSVPDHSIREVRERRALCAEAATMVGARSAIDFEREEAFSDVPTSLSLCAEQGEIPSSPMTQARETAWTTEKKAAKCDDADPGCNIAKAKYVVSCDDESVVLMENKSATAVPRKIGASRIRKSKASHREKPEPAIEDPKSEDPESSEICKTSSGSSFVELEADKCVSSASSGKDYVEVCAPLLADELSKYQMVEKSASQSDDDIVHVKSTDDCSEAARKNSKSTTSDDDMEHIHSSEIAELEEKAKKDIEEPKTCNVLSSDDDLEHVMHSDLLGATRETVPPSVETIKKKEPDTKSSVTGIKRGKAKGKRASQIPIADAVEIIDIDAEISKESKKNPVEVTLEVVKPPSELILPPVVPEVNEPSSKSIFSPVEIIDLDAERQKAEVEVTSECKIVEEPAPRLQPKNSKNARRNKKSQKAEMKAETAESVNSWSSVVRRKTKSPEPETEDKVQVPVLDIQPDHQETTKESTEKVVSGESAKNASGIEGNVKPSKDEQLLLALLSQNSATPSTDNLPEIEKKSDSEQETTLPEKSGSSSDDSNSKLPADGTEEVDRFRDKGDANELGNPTGPLNMLPFWGSAPAKKNNRSKKKKRR